MSYAPAGWYVRHDRDGHPRCAVWYTGPYASEGEAVGAAAEARAKRPLRPGPNGPIDWVAARYCAPRKDLVAAA